MVIIGITDIHGYTGNLNMLKKVTSSADAVVVSGDITDFGDKQDAVHVMDSIAEFNQNIFAVPGNCDYQGVEKYLLDKNWNVNSTVKYFNGYSMLGLGGSLPCPGPTPREYNEKEYEEFISILMKKVNIESHTILVSHQPPINTLNDEVTPGYHVGSKSIRNFIEELQPIVCFTGHIHEGIGIDKINRTRVINPGPLKFGKYAYVRILDSQVVEIKIKDL